MLDNQFLLHTDRESRQEDSPEKDGLEDSEVKESFDISEFKKRVNHQVSASLPPNQQTSVSEFEIPASYLETEADASKLISYNPTVNYYPESIVEQSVEEGSSQFIHQSSH